PPPGIRPTSALRPVGERSARGRREWEEAGPGSARRRPDRRGWRRHRRARTMASTSPLSSRGDWYRTGSTSRGRGGELLAAAVYPPPGLGGPPRRRWRHTR